MGNSPSSHFSEHYKAGRAIGSGTFATVKKCTRRSDKSEFAVKIIYKDQLTFAERDKIRDEIKILKKMKSHKHPHIINIEDVFENDRKVKMVMELCQDKHLLHLIRDSPNRRLPEKTSAQIIHTITKSLKYLHANYVVHRDLKPENILFTADGTLKIADFGSAYIYKKDEHNKIKSIMKTNIGTPLYVAPEILTGKVYSPMCDLWSLGVILYICLCGYHPFSSGRKSLDKMYKNIMNGTYKFSSPLWDNIDNDAIDLVRKLLTVDANKRISCDELLAHKWILKHINNS